MVSETQMTYLLFLSFLSFLTFSLSLPLCLCLSLFLLKTAVLVGEKKSEFLELWLHCNCVSCCHPSKVIHIKLKKGHICIYEKYQHFLHVFGNSYFSDNPNRYLNKSTKASFHAIQIGRRGRKLCFPPKIVKSLNSAETPCAACLDVRIGMRQWSQKKQNWCFLSVFSPNKTAEENWSQQPGHLSPNPECRMH